MPGMMPGMEPFKNLLGPAEVAAAGAHLQRVWPAFDRQAFEAAALTGLDALEFKARAQHIRRALAATLPADFDRACGVLEAALAPARADDTLPGGSSEAGLAGWVVWPLTDYVATHGLDDPDRALAALHAMTQRFTAEFAIRPLIVQHPERVFATLAQWVSDPSAHVRRLVSEGSRPRLPWGLRLQALVADPSPTLPLLARLQDDTSEYVRRSVANHLNDIAKDHPDLIVQWLAEHLPQAPDTRRRLLRHACRSLIKQGHAGVLGHWGLGQAFAGRAELTLSDRQVQVGGVITLTVRLHSTAAAEQALEVDYVVHHVKADGRTTPKVFKGWRLTLPPKAQGVWTKRHSLRPITTRRYHAGLHRVALQVNGTTVAEAAFDLAS